MPRLVFFLVLVMQQWPQADIDASPSFFLVLVMQQWPQADIDASPSFFFIFGDATMATSRC